jgi:hypothetical protein
MSFTADRNDIDPLCRIVSADTNDANNQHRRLCVAVLTSSYFKEMVRYPQPNVYSCNEEEVAFRIAEPDGRTYTERMMRCSFTYVNPLKGQHFLYISRAYKSDHVFAYIRDPADQKLYLEVMCTNVTVVDELNSFDFVEQ